MYYYCNLMQHNLSLIDIKNYSRIDSIDKNFIKLNLEEQKKYIISKLHLANWYKSIFRIEYNTYLFYKNNNFEIELVEEDKKYLFVIENIDIRIRIQDYFFIKFMHQMKKSRSDWFIDNYLDSKKVIVEHPTPTHRNDKSYRVDYLFHISDNNFLSIEFFENAHKNRDDPDFKKEKNRIYSIIHDSNDFYKKILFFAIFWETKINDKKYFKKFVNVINKKIEQLKDIDNEEKWCIEGIDKFINRPVLSKEIYHAYYSNHPTIPIEIINQIIKFKDEPSKNKHINEFFEDIQELEQYRNLNSNKNDEFELDEDEDPDDYDKLIMGKKKILCQENKLSIAGLTRYLKIKRKYLESILEEEVILTIFTNITNGFVSGLKEQRNLLLNLENNRIIGLQLVA